MRQINHTELAKYGMFFPTVKGLLDTHELGMDYSVAMDAQPALTTTSNAGIPAFLTNYLDPDVIEVLFTPNKAVKIAGETIKGDWTTQTAMFPVIESTGEVSSYGDFNENGSTGANANWVSRQSYLFQTMTQWGELELARAGEAKINWAQQLNMASALIIDKFMNNSYFFGIAGLQNYGILNDPSLPASLSPGPAIAGNGDTGTTWALKSAESIYADVVALYAQAVLQLNGLIDRESPFVMATTPEVEARLTETNIYNFNVYDKIKKNFPNIRIETAPQYALQSGNLIQFFVEKIDGDKTMYCAYNEKMRAHPVVLGASSYKQKKTSGTWGAIIRRPVAVVSMLGV